MGHGKNSTHIGLTSNVPYLSQVCSYIVKIFKYFFLICIIDGSTDVIEEAIYYFKANIFFKNYEIKVWTNLVASLNDIRRKT